MKTISPDKPKVDEAKIRDALHLVWRNLPGIASTFGPCARNCGRGPGGRGGGPCLLCAQDDLSALVGAEMAAKYVAVVRDGLRALENEMLHGPDA